MIKKLKIGLLIAVLSLFVEVGSVNAADLNWSVDTPITVNSMTFVIHAGSEATTLDVAANTFTVTVPAASNFVISNASGYSLANDIGIGQSCTATGSSVTVSGAQTVIFTPVATACTPIAGGGGGGGGGGSGDTTAPANASISINAGATTTSTLSATLSLSATDNALVTQMIVSNDAGFGGASWESYVTSKTWTLVSGDGVKTVYAKFRDAAGNMSTAVSDTITVSGSGTVAPVVTVPAPTQGCSGNNKYNTSTGALCVNNAGPVTLSVTSVPSTYDLGTKTLKNGSKGEPVKELQRVLNKLLNLGLIVDGKLGPKTIAVIKKWQKAHNLVADGLVGAKTKAKMKAEAEKD